jgi:tellurite resistance protein
MSNSRATRPVGRDQWLRRYPIALGLGGLSGAWRTAVGLGAPAWPAVSLAVLCFGAWLTVTVMYFVEGRGDPRALLGDLRHPEQGFALGYIPVIPMVLLAQAPRARGIHILDLVVAAVWAIATAALVANWITTPRDRHAIHPGFSLPVVGGPFIACISLQANGWHHLAEGTFAVGVYFWMMFGTVIVGRLMTEQRLSDARFPTLAVLMVPPATASIAWFVLNGNRITTVGTGLAGVLAMMALTQLFVVPEYLRRPFTISAWSFSFPLAATANTVCHWAIAAPTPVGRVLAWSTLVIATAIIGLLAGLTVRKAAPSRPAIRADASNSRTSHLRRASRLFARQARSNAAAAAHRESYEHIVL